MFRSFDFYRGLAVGLGIMYLFDPDRGRTRRAFLRDKAVRAGNAIQGFLGKSARDLSHRAEGSVARATSRLRADDADDATLAERVRAKLGRYVSHPRAVEVDAQDGCVTLRGPILMHEVEELIDAVSSVRGVREVLNRLEPHAGSEGVPALHGSGTSHSGGTAHSPGSWTPGMQLLAGVLGAAVVTVGARRVATRIRRARIEDLESEMPEYAMLR
jgi:uncharacterized membrane protein